jgi:hypothetical protein
MYMSVNIDSILTVAYFKCFVEIRPLQTNVNRQMKQLYGQKITLLAIPVTKFLNEVGHRARNYLTVVFLHCKNEEERQSSQEFSEVLSCDPASGYVHVQWNCLTS